MHHAQSIQQVLPMVSQEISNSSGMTSNVVSGLALTKRTDEDPARTKARRLWYSDTLAKLATFRKITVTPIEEALILSELEDARFTHDEAILAELWILKGDWTYEGKDAKLKLSDFYPDVRKIQYLLDQREIMVIKKVDHQALIKKTFERGKQEGEMARPKEPLDPEFTRTALLYVQANADLGEAQEEIVRLKAELQRKNDRIQTLERRSE